MTKEKQDMQGKGKEGVNDLQKFKTDGGIVRVSDKLSELLGKNGIKKDGRILIFKYMPLVNFLKYFYGNYIYLSSPEKCEDPFETQYKEWLKKQCKSNSEMLNLEVFAACFSSSLESEKASWNEYLVYGADVIRVAIDYDK